MPRQLSQRPTTPKLVRASIASLLDGAIERLQQVEYAPSDERVEELIHEVRKRGKESRALAGLLPRRSGRRATRFDRAVRNGGRALSALRDVQAQARTLEVLARSTSGHALAAIETVQAARTTTLPASERVSADTAKASVRFSKARAELDDWRAGASFDPIADGIERSYRSARRKLAALGAAPHDESLHEWRKAVKRLWYQTKAVCDLAPSVLGPMADALDRLSTLLGDDHDLVVAVEQLTADASALVGEATVATAIQAARALQVRLRTDAMGLGATVLAARPTAFHRCIKQLHENAAEIEPLRV